MQIGLGRVAGVVKKTITPSYSKEPVNIVEVQIAEFDEKNGRESFLTLTPAKGQTLPSRGDEVAYVGDPSAYGSRAGVVLCVRNVQFFPSADEALQYVAVALGLIPQNIEV